MRDNPFDSPSLKTSCKAKLLAWKRLLARPLRPSRISPARKGPANLLLVGVDTLRADHLGFHGYSAATSPHLDRLAGRGTVFTDTTAAAPWTLPSFASALTGVMPGLHGGHLTGSVRNMDQQPPDRLNPEIITLASHLKGQGYRTAAFYSNQFFAFGLAESFDHHHYLNLPAAQVVAEAREWIRRHADRPFFCFILLNDPHEPTTPDAGDLALFLPSAQARGADISPAELASFAHWGRAPATHLGYLEKVDSPLGQGALATKLAVYDATIRGVDRVIGQLQEQLQAWGLADSTLVSVFSDHGEEFLDHVEFARRWNHDPRPIAGIGHGHTHFQELLHVPWLAWGPGVPCGVRCREAVSLCDLAPTVLSWLELPPLEQPSLQSRLSALPPELRQRLQGRNQNVPAADHQDQRVILAEAIAFGPDLVALRQGRWKLIATREGHPLALFDLLGCPEETLDIQQANPEVIARFQAILRQWAESGTGAGGTASPSGSWDDLDDTVRQRLRDLGYSD